MKWWFVFLFLPATLHGEDRWRNEPIRYEAPSQFRQFQHDYVKGAWDGEFIKEPNLANILGNLSVNFTPAAPFADFRDLCANVMKSWESGFKEHKIDVALAVGGFAPFIGETKKVTQAYEAGKDLKLFQKTADLRFAPALESGLTRKLQAAIMTSIKEGEVIAVRARAYGANFLDGKLPIKEAWHSDQVVRTYQNGVRKLEDGSRVISDLDVAWIARHSKMMPENRTLQVGRKIESVYGSRVVAHGDNFNGARRGIDKAVEIENKNEKIYLFNKDGFLDSGPYLGMLRKWGRR